jgi:hypothetical protein
LREARICASDFSSPLVRNGFPLLLSKGTTRSYGQAQMADSKKQGALAKLRQYNPIMAGGITAI